MNSDIFSEHARGDPARRIQYEAAHHAAAHRAAVVFGRLLALERATAHTPAWDDALALFDQLVRDYSSASQEAAEARSLADSLADDAHHAGSSGGDACPAPAPDVRPPARHHQAPHRVTGPPVTTPVTITGTTPRGPVGRLTPRQFLVLQLLARGYTLEQIAQLCRSTLVDVRVLLADTTMQLEVETTEEAVLLAQQYGLIV